MRALTDKEVSAIRAAISGEPFNHKLYESGCRKLRVGMSACPGAPSVPAKAKEWRRDAEASTRFLDLYQAACDRVQRVFCGFWMDNG